MEISLQRSLKGPGIAPTSGGAGTGIWNAGTVNAVNPKQLTVDGSNTLDIVSGPSIATAITPNQMIISAGTAAPVQAPNANTVLQLIGRDGGTSGFEIDAYGGVPVVRYRRFDGTAAAPTAVQANDILGQFNTGGYNGTAPAAGPVVQGRAVENWTTATNGAGLDFQIVPQGSTVPVNALQLQGLTGGKWVNVTGGLSIDQAGTFVANGATAVTIAAAGVTAASAIIISKRANGGTPGAVPQVGTITAGTNFTVSGTALDTSTYNYAIIN